jgi:lipid-binding SYLF domain-containing protein
MERLQSLRSLIPLAVILAVFPTAAGAQTEEAQRIRNAAVALDEIMSADDHRIPTGVLSRAEAVAVFPSTLKGGFVLAGQRGKGVISVRDRATGTWSLPAFLTVTGGSIGAQIGGQAIDLVLVVMNRRGLENLLKNQFKVGADGSVAAGPVGRSAEAATDIQMRAEILSYSRARGLFAGISLNGAAIRQDRDANESFYGDPWHTRSIVLEGKALPQSHHDDIEAWRQALTKYAKPNTP